MLFGIWIPSKCQVHAWPTGMDDPSQPQLANHFSSWMIRPSSDGHDQLMLNAIEHENMILKYIRIHMLHNADSTLKYWNTRKRIIALSRLLETLETSSYTACRRALSNPNLRAADILTARGTACRLDASNSKEAVRQFFASLKFCLKAKDPFSCPNGMKTDG